FEVAKAHWEKLYTDDGAHFDAEVILDAANLPPIVSWGTSPEQVVSVAGHVPNPEDIADETKRKAAVRALDYMGLKGGEKITDIALDRIFIGSCTNGRIEDLRAAAAVLAGRRARVPGLVSPGSAQVKAQAEAEGLDRVFTDAGLEWVASGCSMCVGMNGDLVPEGNRCASSTNRNFRGRQGRGARTHLMSPEMVAAAAVTGAIADVRPLLQGRGR
ncbi:MAG: 3-isopropylmalate dehydratase large subunit, partial [Rhodobacteraceae bacterium]|nr:3-isopropylmalate dehydratase large subunit [Paracoccaceae bacterium]